MNTTNRTINPVNKHAAMKHYLPQIGMEIMNHDFTDAVISDNPLHEWYVLYGMCHAIILLSDDIKIRSHYAELREYFFDKALHEGVSSSVQNAMTGINKASKLG